MINEVIITIRNDMSSTCKSFKLRAEAFRPRNKVNVTIIGAEYEEIIVVDWSIKDTGGELRITRSRVTDPVEGVSMLKPFDIIRALLRVFDKQLRR